MNAYSPDDSQVTVGVINRDVRAVVKEERHLLKAEYIAFAGSEQPLILL
jgi:hypothetical protein